jgi:hypothetical protein
MEVYIIFPTPLTIENTRDFWKKENKTLEKLANMPILKEGAMIRDIRVYYIENERTSYIIQDWGKERKQILGTESFFAEDL